jgi:glycosyltransferase 2 family protein
VKRLPKVSPRVTAALRIAFVAVAVGLLVYALVSQWGSIHRSLARMGPLAVVGSLAAAMLGLFFSALCFRALLTELGNRLPLPATLRVFFLSQVGKYLPGSVWPLLAQVELGRDLGVPRQRSATAGVLFLGLNPLTGLIVAAATLPLVSPDAARHYLWALAVVPIGLAVLHPRVLNPALRQAFRLIRRPPLERPLRAAGLARAAGWLFVMWLCYGLSVLALAGPLGIRGGESFLVSTGAYALAWSAGFLVVIAPAGLGVRDAALVLTLSPVMSVGSATAVAAVSRVVQTAGDGLWALAAGALHAKARLRRETAGTTTATESEGPPGS